MPINISTSAVISLAQSMHHNSDNMKSIVQTMKSRISSFSSWNDRQGIQFKEVTGQISRQLMLHVENFDKMSKFLHIFATKMEEAAREQEQRVNKIK